MLVLLSPAKSLDESPMQRRVRATQPRLLDQAEELASMLQDYSRDELASLMKISDKLADLNYQRYQAFATPLDDSNAKPALFSFTGDVYQHLHPTEYSDEALAYANDHVRILSGLYGLLRPLDYLYPYRLEMGTPLPNPHGNTLYEFWGNTITEQINQDMAELQCDAVINLASQEYSKAINPKALNGRYVTVDFKEHKGGKYQTIGIYAKKARGMMTDFMIHERLNEPEGLKAFQEAAYRCNADLSTDTHYVFTR